MHTVADDQRANLADEASHLLIDGAAIAANYRLLRDLSAPALCAASVKADAYGLGIDYAVPPLTAAGCTTFFVATPGEAEAIRPLAPGATLYALNGMAAGQRQRFMDTAIRPVLNSPQQFSTWWAAAENSADFPAAALHVDTGMSRLGFTVADFEALCAALLPTQRSRISLLISHLASAETPEAAQNAEQKALFDRCRALLPAPPASLAASAGIFLGAGYHYQMVRPGIALYGANPSPDAPNKMRQVVTLKGKILQVRTIDSGMSVGYGATHTVARRSRVATVAAGYADGYLCSLGNRGQGWIDGQLVPVIGRVSMDLLTFDVTGIDPRLAIAGETIELIGPHLTVDRVAAAAGTTSYEILTGLGRRYARHLMAPTAPGRGR